MADEEKKDFNAMLNDSKDMPKIQIITDEKSILKYGGDRMYFAPPMDYDRVMRLVPFGKLLTVGAIREYFARQNSANFTEPITAGNSSQSPPGLGKLPAHGPQGALLVDAQGRREPEREISRRHRGAEGAVRAVIPVPVFPQLLNSCHLL